MAAVPANAPHQRQALARRCVAQWFVTLLGCGYDFLQGGLDFRLGQLPDGETAQHGKNITIQRIAVVRSSRCLYTCLHRTKPSVRQIAKGCSLRSQRTVSILRLFPGKLLLDGSIGVPVNISPDSLVVLLPTTDIPTLPATIFALPDILSSSCRNKFLPLF